MRLHTYNKNFDDKQNMAKRMLTFILTSLTSAETQLNLYVIIMWIFIDISYADMIRYYSRKKQIQINL